MCLTSTEVDATGIECYPIACFGIIGRDVEPWQKKKKIFVDFSHPSVITVKQLL
jgi:hypothetical protein